jgi:hypothetical protein
MPSATWQSEICSVQAEKAIDFVGALQKHTICCIVAITQQNATNTTCCAVAKTQHTFGGDDEVRTRPTGDAWQLCRRTGPPDRLVKDCQHQVEPDPGEMAARYGAETPVPGWRERLVCSKCGSREIDMVVTGDEAMRPRLTPAS